MNFLQLCQRLRSKAGIAGTGPATVVNQAGELGRVVDWITEAYEDIQDKRADWDFLRLDFSFNTVAATSTYAKSTVSNLANWKKDSVRIYQTTVNDEQFLYFKEWDEFRDFRLFGPTASATGRPIEFSIKPDKSLVLWPIPDGIYTIRGEYYRTAHVMTANTDEPLFDRYQMAIVFNALMRYAEYVAEPGVYASAQKEYGRLINKLELDRTSEIGTGGPMA